MEVDNVLWGLGALILLLGCAAPPKFVRTTPGLRVLYRRPAIPCPSHGYFSCEISRKWKVLERTPDGMKFSPKNARATISIAFYPEGSADWKPATAYRQYMREQGSLEDSHVLESVEISSRTANRARFTTYYYDKEYLLGSKVELLYTDRVMVPDASGIYVLSYDTQKKYYLKYLRIYENFLRSIVLKIPKQGEDQRSYFR